MKDLLRIVIIGFLSGAAGAAIVLVISSNDDPFPAEEPAISPGTDDTALLLERIDTLEEQLGTATREDRMANPASPPAIAEPDPEPQALSREERMEQRAQERLGRIESRLRDAGWSDAEISSLTAVQEQANLALEQQQYEAMRQLAAENNGMLMIFQNQRSAMRSALGDEKYEHYLDAVGMPVAVEVRNVLAGSAGEMAGLQQGDKIRRYGSQRVFHEQDLLMAIIEGEPGEYVTIEVERDGAIMHVTVPRGPLGTSRGGPGPF